MQTINQMTLKKNKLSIKELLLILNSNLLNFYYGIKINMGSTITTAISILNLDYLPIKYINKDFMEKISEFLINNEESEEYLLLDNLVQYIIYEIYFENLFNKSLINLIEKKIGKRDITLKMIKNIHKDKEIKKIIKKIKEKKEITEIEKYSKIFEEDET